MTLTWESGELGRWAQLRTQVGQARLLVEGPAGTPAGRLVLGHGAGAGVRSLDLDAAAEAALAAGWQVVRVEQPWFVAGGRVAVAPAQLDLAWRDVLAALPADLGALPTVVGGRSAGARVACRCAAQVGADLRGVLCLAFPLQPPRERPSRLPELALPRAPVLVLQGTRDAFGIPPPARGREVVLVPGADHSFAVRRADGGTPSQVQQVLQASVADWLAQSLT